MQLSSRNLIIISLLLVIGILTILIYSPSFSSLVHAQQKQEQKEENGSLTDDLSQDKSEKLFVKGELLIKTSPKINSGYLLEFFNNGEKNKTSVQFLFQVPNNRTKSVLPGNWFLIKTSESTIDEYIKRLKSNDAILVVERNLIRPLTSNLPNDPHLNLQWYIKNNGQLGGTVGADINVQEAWSVQPGDSNTVVAVIDSGINSNHPDLHDSLWENESEIRDNGIDDDGNGLIDDIHGWNYVHNTNNLTDDTGHGTHVSGIIGAGKNNNTGIAGICGGTSTQPGCRVMTLKACSGNYGGSCLSSHIVQSISYAINPQRDLTAARGAQIINMSFGSHSFSQAEKDIIAIGYDLGVLFVAAAGNNNASEPFYPAAYPEVLAVAASDLNDKKALFSNYGNWIDLTAPGAQIYSTFTVSDYAYQSGTSMAAPMISGSLALLHSQYPHETPASLVQRLKTKAKNIDHLNPAYINQLGAGRIDVSNSLINPVILQAEIINPQAGQSYNNANFINIIGSVQLFENFENSPEIQWEIMHGEGEDPSVWTDARISYKKDQDTSQNNQVLARFSTTNLSDGVYTFKLRVWEREIPSNEASDKVTITFDTNSFGFTQPGWPVQTSSGISRQIFSTPLVIDLDNQADGLGDLEIIVGSHDHNLYVYNSDGSPRAGWPQNLGQKMYAAPSAADINNNGAMELFATTLSGKVYGFDANGNRLPGWESPKSVSSLWSVSPVLADITNDGTKEIIVPDGNGVLRVWNHHGQLLWTHQLTGGAIHSTVAVADFNGDGYPEIVVGTDAGNIHLISHDGSGQLIATASGGIFATPIIATMGNTMSYPGPPPKIIITSYTSDTQGYVEVFDYLGNREWVYATNSGLWSSAVGDITGNNYLEIVAGDFAGNIHVITNEGVGAIIKNLGSSIRSSFAIADLTHNNNKDIVAVSANGTVFAFDRQGTNILTPRQLIGQNSHAGISLADIDRDGDLEIVTADLEGYISIIDLQTSANISTIDWSTYQGNTKRTGLFQRYWLSGDVNMSEQVSSMDAYYMLQHLNGSQLLPNFKVVIGGSLWAPYDQLDQGDVDAALYCTLRGGIPPYCLDGYGI